MKRLMASITSLRLLSHRARVLQQAGHTMRDMMRDRAHALAVPDAVIHLPL